MLTTNDRLIDGIPVTEYEDSLAGCARGVFFLVHGHTGRKEDLRELATRAAAAGYFAVAVDAYKHGARKQAPYHANESKATVMAMPDVILHTCDDLKHLAGTEYRRFFPHCTYGGTSMGGHIAFQMPKYVPAEAIVPFIGTPDLYRHYAVTKQHLVGLPDLAKLKPWLDRLEIGPEYAAYMGTRIVIACGADDPVVDYNFVVDFYDALVRAGHEKIEIALYPVGHEVPAEMQEASLATLTE